MRINLGTYRKDYAKNLARIFRYMKKNRTLRNKFQDYDFIMRSRSYGRRSWDRALKIKDADRVAVYLKLKERV